MPKSRKQTKITPAERAKLIVENCVHPDYRPIIQDYIKRGGSGHSLQSLGAAFGMHLAYGKTGDMRNVNWSQLLA